MDKKDDILLLIKPFNFDNLQGKLSGIFSIISAFFSTLATEYLGMSELVFFGYCGLAVVDLISGLAKVWKNKYKFISNLFARKFLIIGFTGVSLFIFNGFVKSAPNELYEHLFQLVYFLVLFGFIFTELWSIRENAVDAKWIWLVNLVDVTLYPINLVRKILEKRITNK